MSDTVWKNGEVVEAEKNWADQRAKDSETVLEFESWKTVTPVQARLALSGAGLLNSVDQMIANGPPEAKIWYEYAGTWERDHQYVSAFANQLSLSNKQVDDLFKAAKAM